MKQILLLSLMFVVLLTIPASAVRDDEAQSHAMEASLHQVVHTYQFDDYKIYQIDLPVLSHYSYIAVSGTEAAVIDPDRDIDIYLNLAAKEKFDISQVILTHSHADFVAGHMELKKATNATIYTNHLTDAGYPHEKLKTGDIISLGTLQFKMVETPGHTPDSSTYYVSSTKTPEKVDLALTGDTIFIGSVGRPDLIGDGYTPAKLAGMLYDTWQNELTKLPDSALILPAHGAGSLCGANLSDAASSTWGEQKVSNPYLQMKSRNEFIMKVIDGLPVAPQYFGHNAKMNHDGPPLVDWKAPLQKSLTPSKELMDDAKYQLVDVRSAEDYAKGHVPKSLNIGIRGRYETWTGIMIPWGSELVVVGSAKEYEEAVKRLHRIGYEAKFLDYTLWEKSGLPITSNQKITPEALYSQMNHNQAPMIVDVRLKKEWDAERIGAIVNMPVNQLQEEIKRLNTAEPVIAVCNSAYRSSMALGIFERAGFDKATSLDGGGEAWMDAGYPMYGGGEKCQLITEAPVETPAVFVKLADRISPSDLKKMQMDLPGTFDLVDIRPAAGFADWHLSEARHMAIAELLNDPTVLSGKSPLVIVDRDGSLAMMVAGILSQKTDRPVKALHGGLEKYWDASMSGNHSMGSAMGAVNSKKQLTKPTISKPQQVKPPVKNPAPAVKKRKRSAGC